jgi:hypothetical protein
MKELLLNLRQIKRNTEALSAAPGRYFFLASTFTGVCCKAGAARGYRPLLRLGMSTLCQI